MATEEGTTIGFVGLGRMGGNMAARYLAAGYTVYGEERGREHAEALEQAGLQWRETPREVAEAADVVFTSIPDDQVLELVASGPDGILAGLSDAKIWVDMSTVNPRASRELAERPPRAVRRCWTRRCRAACRRVRARRSRSWSAATKTPTHASSRCCSSSAHRLTSAKTGKGSSSNSRSTSALPRRHSRSRNGLLLAEHAGVDPELALQRDDVEPDRLADAEGARADVPGSPRHRLVRCRLDAEGHRTGARQRRAIYDVPLPSTSVVAELLTAAQGHGYEHRDITVLHRLLNDLSAARVHGDSGSQRDPSASGGSAARTAAEREGKASDSDRRHRAAARWGLQAMSMDDVAERAGVSKATIYRWWGSNCSRSTRLPRPGRSPSRLPTATRAV